MDSLREQFMINQLALLAGCNHEQAKQLLQLNNWQFQKALSVLQEAASTSASSQLATTSSSTLSPYHHQTARFNPICGPTNSPFNFPDTLLAFLKLSQASEQHQQSLLNNPNHGLNISNLASNDGRCNTFNHHSLQSTHHRQLASPLYEYITNKTGETSPSLTAMSFNPKPPPAAHVSSSSKSGVNPKKSESNEDKQREKRTLEVVTESSDSRKSGEKPSKRGRSKNRPTPTILPPASSTDQTVVSSAHPSPSNQSLMYSQASQPCHFNPIPFDLPHLSSHHSAVNAKNNNEVSGKEKSDSEKKASGQQMEGDMPLNLSTKKSTSDDQADLGYLAEETSERDFSGSVSVEMSQPHCTINSQKPIDPSFYERPRKRGRKPKSLLANQAEALPMILVPENNETKPRKRGRPPILSSPPASGDDQTDGLKNSTDGSHDDHSIHTSIIPQTWPSYLPSNSFMNNPEPRNVPSAASKYNRKLPENFEATSCASGEISTEETRETEFDLEEEEGEVDKDPSRLVADYNEEDLRKPLKFGWRRQTLIKCFTRSGVEGEVIYYSPCGRKLRNYSDVSRYLIKKGITIVKKDNFTFDPKPIIGEYIEHSKGLDFSILAESEVKSRLEALGKTLKRPRNNSRNELEDSDAFSESDRRHGHDEYDHSGGRNDSYFPKMSEDYRTRVTIEDIDSARDDMLRRYQECKENKRYQTEIFKDSDLYKRRDFQMMAEVDRERRKQHMALIRALDAHKRYEEREKERERMMAEKKAIQETKYRKRKLEIEIMRELKRPVEDMQLKRSTPLPILNRIPGLRLPSKSFAELLMVYEFLHNFGETLGFDMDSLPTLNTLHKALLNINESAEDELISTLHHLLVCAIDDPGTPCHVTTVMGQKLRDAPITNFNLSEILKIYFYSFATASSESPDEINIASDIYSVLKTGKPFLSLNPAQKTEILSFLCNELTGNQAIVRHIEDTMELVANLRKERWHLGCELRKYKAIKLRREKSSEEAGEELKKFDKNEIEGGLLEESAESDVEDNIIITVNETEEDACIVNEELDKKIDKLSKQCSQINTKLNKAIQCLRISPLGQDRYRRRYWFLPAAGGIFIEGIESGQPEEIENNQEEGEDSLTEDEPEGPPQSNTKDSQKSDIDTEVNIETINNSQKMAKSENGESKDEISIEPISVERDKKPSKDVTITIQPIVSQDDMAPVKKEEIKCDMEIEINPASVPISAKDTWALPIGKNSSESSKELKSSEKTKNGPNTNGFVASTPTMDSHSNNTKPSCKKQWFSLLPRTPCNDKTVIYPEKKASSPLDSLNNDKENATKNEQDTSGSALAEGTKSNDQTSGLNGVPSNKLNAFLYPHLLDSFFQQIRPNNGKCPQNSSPSESHPQNANQCISIENDPQNVKPGFDLCSPSHALDSFSKLEAEIAMFQSRFDSPDLAIDPDLERKLTEHRGLQYRKAKKIPKEFQHGWWWITDPKDVGLLVSTLNEKGVRERQLLRHLNKYVSYVSSRCRSSVAELEPDDDDDSTVWLSKDKVPEEWNREVALRLDISVLEQIEALEEKIASSSMQIRGWRPLPKITTDNTIKFELSVSYLLSKVENENDGSENTSSYSNSSNSSSSSKATAGKGSKSEANKKVIDPLKVGRERILSAEAMIERRYLKPPLGFKANTIILSTSSSGGGSDEYADNAADENAPSGLLRWRDAVRECESGSQLALLLHFLESCIAWDKSIMRASCQFCSSGENEAQLLLCDGCDKGYHMYCFKPIMESVPEGDWFCFECQNKNTIDKVCIVCGKKGKLINCDTCPKVFHPNCLDPPVTKPPKGRWCCNMCNRKPKKKIGRKGPNTQTPISTEDKDLPTSFVNSTKESEKRTKPNSRQKKESIPIPEEVVKETKKDRKSKFGDNKEMATCEALLNELEKHDDCWPFLFPVNTKQFPTYKKIIKKPMDFVTIRNRLESGGYKNKPEFISDCRLIFDNCETFNEDESPVGQAGHNMRRFMEKKWKELGGEKVEKS